MENESSAVIPKSKTATAKMSYLSSIEYMMNQLSDDLAGFEKDQLNTLY
jgi:hypothetical protein